MNRHLLCLNSTKGHPKRKYTPRIAEDGRRQPGCGNLREITRLVWPKAATIGRKRCAQQIHIVADNIDDNSEFEQATAALWEANEIYFVGFGYDEKNLARLPIESRHPPGSPGARMGRPRPSLNLFGTAFRLAPARRTRVENYFRNKGLPYLSEAEMRRPISSLEMRNFSEIADSPFSQRRLHISDKGIGTLLR
jgi:hypothetical protein